MSKYILKANSKSQGLVYYMNVIMITGARECAEVFYSRTEAEQNAEHFKRMFFYENITVEIEEI